MNLHQPIKSLVLFYADRLADSMTVKIVQGQSVATEDEARHILAFCERMFELAVDLERERVLINGQPAKAYDAEKAYSVLNDWVSASGFDHLIPE